MVSGGGERVPKLAEAVDSIQDEYCLKPIRWKHSAWGNPEEDKAGRFQLAIVKG